MAPKSTERAHISRNKQRRLMFLRIARTCKSSCRDKNRVTVKKLRSDDHNKDKDSQCIPATATYLEQQANVPAALAGLKIESIRVEKAPLDMLILRESMRTLVLNTVQKHVPCPGDDDASKAKYMSVARHLEHMLFNMAISKEEYVNESTLEYRIASLIKGRHLKRYNLRHTMVGKMVPSRGLSHAGSSMVTSSACASVGLEPSRNTIVPMDHDVLKVRGYMRTLVFRELHKHQPCSADDASKAKYLDVARRLEEGLFQMANTREDYLNPLTLDSLLATLIRGKKLNNQQNANSSLPGTMTTLALEAPAETTMVKEKVPESEDQLETEIAENLKSMSL